MAVFHAELRRFPHLTHAFNMSEQELRARILDAWQTGATVELGDHRWLPEQTKLRILEGRELAASELSMGRGWAAAQRHGSDVTVRMLASAPAAPPISEPDRVLATELLARAAAGPLRLAQVWRVLHERHEQWTASTCIAATERALGVLLADDLVRLQGNGGALSAADAAARLRDPDTWGAAALALSVTDRGAQSLARRDN